ncbi:MAG: AEC family transporter [Bacteroidota bacterium]
MDTFLIAIKTVLPLFLVIFTGTLFSRTKINAESWIETLNKYALNIGFPALVVASLMSLEIGEQSYTELILYNSAIIIFSMLLAFPIARILKLSNKLRRTLFMVLPFPNIAYLGIPVLQNSLGEQILPVAAIIAATYVFWMLTLGILLVEITGEQKMQPQKLILSLVQNPLLLSVFIGLAIVLLKFKVPVVAEKTIHLFADSVTAIVLFSLGIFLGMQKIGKINEWYRVIALVGVTSLLLPFAFYEFLILMKFDTQLMKASVIDSAMPLGLTPYALSVQYKLETTMVARIVVLGTLLSVFIIPVWLVFLG